MCFFWIIAGLKRYKERLLVSLMSLTMNMFYYHYIWINILTIFNSLMTWLEMLKIPI